MFPVILLKVKPVVRQYLYFSLKLYFMYNKIMWQWRPLEWRHAQMYFCERLNNVVTRALGFLYFVNTF